MRAFGELGLHEGLERNGKGAFGRCEGLTKVDIPSTVKLIDNVAFLDCKGLEFLSLKDGLEQIGKGAFYGCRGFQTMRILERIALSINCQRDW
eukprot:scaffold2418_cov166-Cylindrotheca_fusiformis.AAC.1